MQVDKRSKYAPLTGNIIIKNLIDLLFFFFFSFIVFLQLRKFGVGKTR